MAYLLNDVYDLYRDLIENRSDPRVKDWPLMSSPFPTMAMCVLYAYFSKSLAPKLMSNRKPMDLRQILVIYNLFQTIFSAWIFYEYLQSGWLSHYSLKCQPVDYSNSPLALRMAATCWWYYIAKFTEIFDTMFFILRKKNEHVSTLHVIHHGCMPFSVWLGMKFAPASCKEKPTIASISPEQVKNIGESAILNCTVKNPDEYAVIWAKKDRDHPTENVFLSINNQMTMKDPRFELKISNDSTSYLLQISDIQTTDTAIYECQIIISANVKVTSHVELLVRTPPYATTISVTSGSNTSKSTDASTISVTVASGNSAELKCIAEGYPRPSISWVREYNAIMPSGGHSFSGNILQISSVVKEDRGTYYCIAENVVGKDKKNIDFEVEFAPIISIPRPKVAQALDYDIELECNVIAFPAPAVFWYRNGVQLNNNENDYGISNLATVDEITNSVLRVKTVEGDQYGEYYCKASNKIGHSEARIILYDQQVPNIYFAGLQWSSCESMYHFNLDLLLGCVVGIMINFPLNV